MKKTAQIHSTTQKFTEIEDIFENIVILSGGNACLLIEITATNFSLLSQEEQDAKIYSYASLLNSLSFPIQIVIKNQRLDISSYLKSLDEQARLTQNQLLSQQITSYRNFIQELIKVNTVLDKKFYVVLSYSYLENGVKAAKGSSKKIASDTSFINQAKASLQSKAESLHSQLSRLNLRARTLGKEELVKVFYEIFNDSVIESSQVSDNTKTAVVKGGRG